MTAPGPLWQRIEAIYHAVLDAPRPDRHAVLDRLCEGDEAVRREVESLVASHDAADGFLENPAMDAPSQWLTSDPAGRRPPEIPGHLILRKLGEGSTGLVFVAERQSNPPELVAIKVIKPGVDARQVVARFNMDRRALAARPHPHIAPAIEAGSTVGGRSYFVSRFIDGPPIVEFARGARLSTRARLEMFVSICDAVQHAHDCGVVHGDLKPSDVIVRTEDGRSTAAIIGFGTAAAMTRTWDRQPDASAPLDRGGDVFALGMVLSALFLGTPKGDLWWIVRKALDRDQDRRYPSAAALKTEVERHLNHEPVEAHPSSLTYRLQKGARRHRLALIGAGVAIGLFAAWQTL